MFNEQILSRFESKKKLHIVARPNGNPCLFVTTEKKYDEDVTGDAAGAWADLTTFGSYDEFKEFCLLLHHDEEQPSIFFSDYDSLLTELYEEIKYMNESSNLREYMNASEENREIFASYIEAISDTSRGYYGTASWDEVEKKYVGNYYDEEEFGRSMAETRVSAYAIEELEDFIDFEKYGRHLLATDYVMSSDGNVFKNNK